jgi:hypothetical protein
MALNSPAIMLNSFDSSDECISLWISVEMSVSFGPESDTPLVREEFDPPFDSDALL